jgi:hypothetical protein
MSTDTTDELAARLYELAEDERDEKCVNGHDACDQMVDRSQCPYCEPSISKLGQLALDAAARIDALDAEVARLRSELGKAR